MLGLDWTTGPRRRSNQRREQAGKRHKCRHPREASAHPNLHTHTQNVRHMRRGGRKATAVTPKPNQKKMWHSRWLKQKNHLILIPKTQHKVILLLFSASEAMTFVFWKYHLYKRNWFWWSGTQWFYWWTIQINKVNVCTKVNCCLRVYWIPRETASKQKMCHASLYITNRHSNKYPTICYHLKTLLFYMGSRKDLWAVKHTYTIRLFDICK